MARIVDREASVRFPFSAADNTMTLPCGNQRIAVTGAAQTYAIPEAMRGKFIRFRAIGVEVQVSSHTAATSMVLDQASSAAAGTSSAACAMTLFAGEFFDAELEPQATHLCWIGRSATGFVEFFISEQKFGG